MGFKFNPFTGNFDQTGSGGGSTVFDGEVQFFSDLPQSVGTPPVNSAYLVRESEGTIWFGNKKQKGIYIRSGNSGVRNDDWTYGGEYPVTSVNGQTGAVTVAAAQHASEHEAGEADEIQAMAALVDTDYLPLNGVYFHDGTLTSGRPNFFKTGTRKNTKLRWNNSTSEWELIRNLTLEAVGWGGTTTFPWTVNNWADGRDPAVVETIAVTRLGLEDMTQKLAETGSAATATTSQDGLISAADQQKLNGIASGAEVNVQSNWTEADTASDAFILNKPSTFAPSLHSSSHAADGSDPLAPSDIGAADASHTHSVYGEIQNAILDDPSTCITDIFGGTDEPFNASGKVFGLDESSNPVRYAVSDFAEGNHTHELTALAATGATNGHVLTANGSGGVTFAAASGGGVTGAASSASDVLGVSGANITGVDANADRIVFWDDSASALKYLEVSTGLSLSGTTLSATGGGVTTGSVDNAIIRADGTGGSTSQGSAFVIADNATASPNNTVNHASIQATGDTANVSVSIVPKGTGAFMLRVPDNASTGGNARGVNAVDLMLERLAANQVASGEASFAAGARHVVSGTRAAAVGGYGSTASGNNAVTLGALNTATGETAGSLCGYGNNATASESVVVGGNNNTASAARSVTIGGNNNTASADAAICLGGKNAAANRFSIHAHAAGQFAAQGDAQRIRAVLRCKTTTNAAVEMALDGSTTYLTIPSGKVIHAEIRIVGSKSDGTAVACYTRQYAAKNVAGTSSEVFAPVTIGTDTTAGTSLEVATVDAGDYIRIRPTGIASETWRWVASVDAVEVAYGT